MYYAVVDISCQGHSNLSQGQMVGETWYSCLWTQIEYRTTLFNPDIYTVLWRNLDMVSIWYQVVH